MEDIVMPEPDRDYASFFLGHEFKASFPNMTIPPPSFVTNGAEILSFEAGKYITLAFPVRESQINPLGTLQGGILAGFIDDAFGVLSFASLRKPCISIDLHLNFIRAAKPGSVITVRAEFKAKSRKIQQFYAEAFTSNRKILATATSNMMVWEE